jgi:hypothetical protein
MYGTELTGYRKRLKEVYSHASKDEQFEGTMTQWMQKDYPGNYTVQEAYMPDRFCWGAKLVFESEQEEIMFKLRYE